MKLKRLFIAAAILACTLKAEAADKGDNVMKLNDGKTVSLICPDERGWNFRTILKNDGNGREYVTVHMDRSEADAPPKFELVVDMPQTDICHFWSSANDRPVLEASWKGAYSSQIASGIPVYEFFDANCVNRLTMALDEPFRLVKLKSGVHEEGSRTVSRFLFFTMPEAPLDSYEVTLLLDSRPVFWAETIKEASEWISTAKGLELCNVPKEAFLPLYSSWYQFHQGVSAGEIEAEAARAARAGMKVIIVDDGWQTDDGHRGYAFCGDWQVSPNKFPDMRAHVKKVQDMGLKYMLWYSVPFVGYNSRNYDRFKGKYLYNIDNLKASVLDPRFPEVRNFLTAVYETALKDWGLDGFKLDFIDSFLIAGKDPAVGENYAGRDIKSIPDAVDLLMKTIVDRLRSINPDILIEFRQKYIGPAIRQYGNMFRAGDCPGNAMTNRIRTTNLRLTSGNTAVHADMLEWNNAETPEAAARNIISSIFSVVQYSVMLRTLPQSHLDMVRNWMEFSVNHSKTLLEGEFKPYHPEAGYPLIEASSEAETILGVYADNIVVPVSRPMETYILNATGAEEMVVDLPVKVLKAYVTDACGRVQAVKAPRKGLSRVRIPDGGYMKLTFVKQ